MNSKLIFGVLSIIPAVFAYYFYFRAIFSGKTKPHAFSWLVWGILAGNGFFAQISANAGIGAWATGLTSVVSLTIFCFALYRGDTQPTWFDRAMLGIALTSLVLLLAIDSKEIALCLTLIALVAGFAMTFRKAYKKPAEENATAFFLNTLKFIPAIFALSSFSFLTVAYPLVAGVGNVSIAAVVLARGKRLAYRSQAPSPS